MATTPTPLYRYPLDPTGLSPDNLVVGEEHQLSNRAVRCIAPTYGGFFADSVLVKDFATNMALVRGTDYNFGELFEFPTGRYGKEIFGIIAITKPGVTMVTVDYQALGGDYSYSMDAVIAMLDNLNLGDRPVAWPDIVGRPALFEPASHFHDVGDVYGFEYVVHALDLLRQAILMGDTVSHDEIYRYIDRWGTASSDAINQVASDLAAHKADVGNPHQTTKAQVGLGSVQNYGVALQADMDAGISNVLYLTPVTVAKYVTDKAVTPLNTHIARMDNPHQTTAAQVGLGNVQNYAVASDAVAQAGTSTNTYMTPALTASLITAKVGNAMDAHISNINNPHNTTAFQVGAYTKAEADVITNGIKGTMNAHIANTANPHGTTAAQVGAYTTAQIDGTVNNLQGQINGKQPNGNYAVQGTSVVFANITATGTIYSSNDIWAFNSDRRIKTDIRLIENALEKVRQIRGVLYKYTSEAIAALGMEERDYMGVIAQEIQAIAPEIVGLAPFDRDPETGLSISGKNYLTVQYDKLTALLIEATKESDARVTEMAARMTEMASRLGFTDLM